MFKPLLRTMPSLSGNLKLVCFLDDYNELEENVFECNIRTARLNAISSQLFNRYINIPLLGSSYEWDVPKFYRKYSEYFYKTLFDYDKEGLPMYDEFGTNRNRNTDFEYGCKRVSYMKSSKQFGFFAPIYIEGEDDIPDYFEISIDINNAVFKAVRKIIVNIGRRLNDGPNYIGKYLYDYATKIDDKVCYVNKEKYEGIYYGIDVERGGFGKKHDNRWQSLLTKQNSILNFDNVITKGMERSHLVMKQVIPLSFYFSLNDILTDVEKTMFYGAEIKVSGTWYKDGLQSQLYDFATNYTSMSPQLLMLNTENGNLLWRQPSTKDAEGNVSTINIMNVGYPSMREALYYKYHLSNKVAPNFSRWKLKYSSDSHPYVTNMSGAFSLYQGSKVKYGQYPSMYEGLCGIVTKKPFYLNLFLPLNGGEDKYPHTTVTKYYRIYNNNYSAGWFDTFEDIHSALDKCVDVHDDKAYFNGILYNLDILNQLTPKRYGQKPIKIDRFGVFVRPVFHFISDEQIRNENIYSLYTIFKEGSHYITDLGYPNCHVNDNVLTKRNPNIYANQQTKVRRDMVAMSKIFVSNKDDDGDFISLAKYGVDYYEANDFVRLQDVRDQVSDTVFMELRRIAKEGYEVLPITRVSNLLQNDRIAYKMSNSLNCYISNQSASMKTVFIDDLELSKDAVKNKYRTNETLLYRKSDFVTRDEVIDAIRNSYVTYATFKYPSMSPGEVSDVADIFTDYAKTYNIYPLPSYYYNPVIQGSDGIAYARDVFTGSYMYSSRFYGNDCQYASEKFVPKRWEPLSSALVVIPKQTYTYTFDKDFIYVDPYNINSIISHYNQTWLKNDDNKLSYYALEGEEWDDPILPNMVMSSLDYKDNPFYTKGAHWETMSKEYRDMVTQFIDRHIQHVVHPVYEEYNDGDKTKLILLGYNNAYILRVTRSGRTIMVTLDGQSPKPYEDIVNEWGNQKTFEHNGKMYSWHDISAAIRLLSFDLQYDIENDSYWIKTYFGWLYSNIGLQNSWFVNQPNVTIMDNFKSAYLPVRFLNKMHLRWYFKCLYSQYPSQRDYSIDEGYNYFNSIYIRKRVIRDDLSVQDALIPLYNIFNLNDISGNIESKLNSFLRVIEYDDESQLFYFNSINYINNTVRRFNSTAKVTSQLLFWDLDNYIDKETDTFDPKKFKFELVYKKRMIKADDNIWRLMNLEEKYAAPYKDLYVYEYEHPEHYNPNLFIQPSDVRFCYGGETLDTQCSLKGVTYNMIGGVMPMFNMVQIETKDESRIYTEYSINNITRATVDDGMRIDVYKEHIEYDTLGNRVFRYEKVSAKETHFYRHNANNALCMFDLSTINREVPVDIRGTKYIYRSSLDYDIKDPAYADLPTASYEYFHDTYDLFRMDEVGFANYADVETCYVPVGVQEKEVEYIVPVRASYNSESFRQQHNDIYNNASCYNDPGVYEVVNYIDEEHMERSYKVDKHITPTKNVTFVMQSYQLVTTKEPTEEYAYQNVYTYYDDLNIYKDHYLSTYTYNGLTYGFYLIDVNVNNTINCMNVSAYDGEFIKYVSYINGVRLSDEGSDKAITGIYKQIMPFVRNNPLRYFMTNAYTIVKPDLYNIGIDYQPVEVYDKSGKLTYYDVKFGGRGEFGTMVCERYFDEITPILTPTTSVMTYNLKYKDMDKGFRPAYFTNEVIYPLDTSISQYPGVRIYDMRNTERYRIVSDYEYKHFNANRMFNLEEQFSYKYEELMTIRDVRIAQSDVKVYEKFRDHMMNYTSSRLDEDGIQYVFTKYKVTFAYDGERLDYDSNEKLYRLEIIFTLY